MAGLSGSSDERDSGGRGSGIAVWAVLIVLAVGATGVLVLSNDARLLRLAIVGALWAALIGAFAAARYRRAVAQRDNSAAELRAVYELELEREVAARREYELEVESETRRRLQNEARDEVADDLAALRGELRTMREHLEVLFGGEVLVERVALRAESTRMRSLPDQPQRMLAAAREGRQRGIVAGSIGKALSSGRQANGSAAAKEPQTELMPAVGDDGWAEAQRRDRRGEVRAARSEPARPERNRRDPAEQRPQGPTTARREAGKMESQPDAVPSAAMARSNLAASMAAARRPVPAPDPAEESWPGHGWEQGGERTGQGPLPRRAGSDPASRADLPRVGGAELSQSNPPRRVDPTGRDGSAVRSQYVERPSTDHPLQVNPGPRSEQSLYFDQPRQYEQAHYVEQVQQEPHEPHIPHDEGMPPAMAHGESPGYQEHVYEDAPMPASHDAVPPLDDAGAHASGRSVSDLLAAHGTAEPVRRRRRRAE